MAERPEKQPERRSRVSSTALVEIESALRDYEAEVLKAAQATDGISAATVKTYTDGPEKFVAWLKYAFVLAPSPKGQTPAKPGFAALRTGRPVATKSRISLSTHAEVDVVFEEFVRDVLRAEKGQRATNQLGDHAEYFVRWLRYEFVPGARKGWRKEVREGPSAPTGAGNG